jgi:CheY-like chemotaxis protein
MFLAPAVLANKRVLVIEDESVVAFLIEDFLTEFGCIIVDTCCSLAAALQAVETKFFDLAVLDVNLRGERSYPVAEALTAQRIPFLLTSGYGELAVPPGCDWTVCSKPFTQEVFGTLLASLFVERRQ